jgi:hypothetical protein
MVVLPVKDSAPNGITITMMTMSERKAEKSLRILPRILTKLWEKGEFNHPKRSEKEVANHGS